MPIGRVSGSSGVGIFPLSRGWTHEQVASEAMVLTNTIDNEAIQLDNVRNHINANISYLAELLNLAASPFYGIYATFCFEPQLHDSGVEYLDLTDSVNNNANNIANLIFDMKRINIYEVMTGTTPHWNGNVIKWDISQIMQQNAMQNVQSRHTVAWSHFGSEVLFFVGDNISSANRPARRRVDYVLQCCNQAGVQAISAIEASVQTILNPAYVGQWATIMDDITSATWANNKMTIGFRRPVSTTPGEGTFLDIHVANQTTGWTTDNDIDYIYDLSETPVSKRNFTVTPMDNPPAEWPNAVILEFDWTSADNDHYIYFWDTLNEHFVGAIKVNFLETGNPEPQHACGRFVLWAMRTPILDALLRPDDPSLQNNYRGMVDLPDRYVDLLIKMTQKKILEQIREQVPQVLEQEINQGLANINQLIGSELQFEAAEREKRKYGSQQRPPGAM